MNEYLKSAAEFIDKPLDCRRLALSLRFYMLSTVQVFELCNELMRFAYNLTNNAALFKWYIAGKHISQSRIWAELEKPISQNEEVSVDFESYILSKAVYNGTTLRKHQNYIQRAHPYYQFGWVCDPLIGLSSIDYPSYFNRLFPDGRPENGALIERISDIFYEADRRWLSFHNCDDYNGHFSAKPYQHMADTYYGEASISFSAFCVSSILDEMAETFARFAQKLSEYYTNINLHVGLQTGVLNRDPYMRYFGNHAIFDGSHQNNHCLEQEWYSTYYLCSVQWLNIVSPLTQNHIRNRLEPETNRNADLVDVMILPKGGIAVKAKGKVSDYDIHAAFALKAILRDSLWPGGSSLPLRGLFPKNGEWRVYAWCPRDDWAIVPIEKEEIHIIGTELVYRCSNAERFM